MFEPASNAGAHALVIQKRIFRLRPPRKNIGVVSMMTTGEAYKKSQELLRMRQKITVKRGYFNKTLEDYAYMFGTAKSRDDNKYVDFYASILNPVRREIKLLIEIGVGAGQSLQMWNKYLPSANISGFDITFTEEVRDMLKKLEPRPAELRIGKISKL